MEWGPRNASELGVPVGACQREPGWRSPELEEYGTKSNFVHSEGPRVYKGAYPGGQNGNPS